MSEYKYTNESPKDFISAIWGACFDYIDFDTVVDGITVRDRLYECWQNLHRNLKGNTDWLVDFINKNEPEPRFEGDKKDAK